MTIQFLISNRNPEELIETSKDNLTKSLWTKVPYHPDKRSGEGFFKTD